MLLYILTCHKLHLVKVSGSTFLSNKEFIYSKFTAGKFNFPVLTLINLLSEINQPLPHKIWILIYLGIEYQPGVIYMQVVIFSILHLSHFLTFCYCVMLLSQIQFHMRSNNRLTWNSDVTHTPSTIIFCDVFSHHIFDYIILQQISNTFLVLVVSAKIAVISKDQKCYHTFIHYDDYKERQPCSSQQICIITIIHSYILHCDND